MNLRKEKNYLVTDKIDLLILKNESIDSALKNNLTYICNETLTDKAFFTDKIQNEMNVIELTEGLSVNVLITKKQTVVKKTAYSKKELKEFKELILAKIASAEEDLSVLQAAYSNDSDNGTEDTAPTFKAFEESSSTLSKEENMKLAERQEKFIRNLKNALIRIENNSYGVCRVTGKLISKERLRLVPHATLSIEAKKLQQSLFGKANI